MSWTSPIGDDFEGALRVVLASLAELRGQDEPFFAAVAGAPSRGRHSDPPGSNVGRRG